jgi:hypothetical protein
MANGTKVERMNRQAAISVLLVAGGAILVAAALLSPSWISTADPADLVTRQTARVAVLFWGIAAAAIAGRIRRRDARLAWTLGCIAYLVHVATAFDQVHRWSHAAAFEHVQSVSGFGPGIFVSYFFSLLWLIDVVWWWFDADGYEGRSKWLDRGLHGFMAFVVFNGTVVYETGFIRWAGLALFAILALLVVQNRLNIGRGERIQTGR